MVTAQGLHEQLADKVNEIESIVSGIDGAAATNKPSVEEWCINEVLSHLIGEELGVWRTRIEAFVNENTPLIDIRPGISYAEKRSGKTTAELLAEVESTYGEFGTYLAGLSEEQLNRKAQVPLFKETPLGEYPTLAQFAAGVINYHIADHVQQLRSLCQQ